MNVLLFSPSPKKLTADKVLGILHSAATPDLNVDTVDESKNTLSLGDKRYDAVIILYTPAVEFSGTLFEIVRYIDQRRPQGRFIFLPKTGEKEVIPPIFHPIRALQLRLLYYSFPENLDAQLEEFRKDWVKFVQPVPAENASTKSRGARSRQAGFGLILFVSIFILFLVGLIAVIVPTAQKTIFSPTPTSLHPPTAAAFWLQESFQTTDTTKRWQEQHYYTGQQAMQTTFPGTGLHLSASPVVTEAVFQLDSLQSWPLDELQSLTFSFAISVMDDPAAQNALIIGLILSEDSSYRLDCVIVPAGADGRIQCQIQSPEQAKALSAAIPISLGARHTATLVFDPLTYTFQFFLDDIYFGQREIQAVEYWRTREFKIQIRAEAQNLNNGSFSCELYSLKLAHQP